MANSSNGLKNDLSKLSDFQTHVIFTILSDIECLSAPIARSAYTVKTLFKGSMIQVTGKLFSRPGEIAFTYFTISTLS